MPGLTKDNYAELLKNTEEKGIFDAYNGQALDTLINKPYLIYNSCGPLDDTEIECFHGQAFPDRNKDCLYLAVVELLLEEEKLDALKLPTFIEKAKTGWSEEGRSNIPIHREVKNTINGQKYVQFSIMIDYTKIQQAAMFKAVKVYKKLLKSNKQIYNSLPFSIEEKNIKQVSLQMIKLNLSHMRMTQEKTLYYEKTSFAGILQNLSCNALDAGCNPQKRFSAQLASIVAFGKSALIIEKKAEKYSHYVIQLNNSSKTVCIDGYVYDHDRFYQASLWSEQGYYQFLKFLKLPLHSKNEEIKDDQVSTSYPVRLEQGTIDKSSAYQVSTYNEEKGDYQALFSYTPDPHFQGDNLYGCGFKSGLAISLPCDILLLEMAKFTKHNVEKAMDQKILRDLELEMKVLEKMKKELFGEEVVYAENEMPHYKKFCEYLLVSDLKGLKEAEISECDSEISELLMTNKYNILNYLKEFELLSARRVELDAAIEQLRVSVVEAKYTVRPILQQYVSAVKHEAARELKFLNKHTASILHDAKAGYQILEQIKQKIQSRGLLNQDEIDFLSKRKINPHTENIVEFKKIIGELSEEFMMKQKELSARMNLLKDVIHYSLTGVQDSFFYFSQENGSGLQDPIIICQNQSSLNQ